MWCGSQVSQPASQPAQSTINQSAEWITCSIDSAAFFLSLSTFTKQNRLCPILTSEPLFFLPAPNRSCSPHLLSFSPRSAIPSNSSGLAPLFFCRPLFFFPEARRRKPPPTQDEISSSRTAPNRSLSSISINSLRRSLALLQFLHDYTAPPTPVDHYSRCIGFFVFIS